MAAAAAKEISTDAAGAAVLAGMDVTFHIKTMKAFLGKSSDLH